VTNYVSASTIGTSTCTQCQTGTVCHSRIPCYTKAHPVFHISELLPYTATNHEDMHRPELTADNHYIVQSITKHHQRHDQRQYLVKWKGYPISDSTYEPWENLTNVEDLVRQYCSERNRSFIHDQ